ncbi:hypothetical protein JCM21738_4976 [Mesobacillus boroniphilus JCM 21738]|uniref:Uncharacterized protein n=1 Tax=Mesobacillus boroniphilus JCM 21738 TaxID=1294265 RepID=W4RV22_9BACI|nr:hypothetical protein JCM21738_4976 [Mesobacillus boroniphilus JCM 21738]
MLLLIIFVVAGCSNTSADKEEDPDFNIIDAMTSIGAVDETFDKQKLQYEFTIDKGKSTIKEDSIQVVLTDWTKDKLIENKITEKRFNEDNIVVKGYVIFESKELTKKNITENQPLIEGIKVNNESDEEIFIKREFNNG